MGQGERQDEETVQRDTVKMTWGDPDLERKPSYEEKMYVGKIPDLWKCEYKIIMEDKRGLPMHIWGSW